MNLFDLHETKHDRKLRSGKAASKRRTLAQMSEAETKALPERELMRLLGSKLARAYLASRRLKGKI